jgi:hypothetical protein
MQDKQLKIWNTCNLGRNVRQMKAKEVFNTSKQLQISKHLFADQT